MTSSLPVCHWHPDRATGLQCGNCGKSICWECVRQHPVGVRCKECARLSRLPTYQVSPAYIARGVGAAVALGLVGAVVLPLLVRYIPFLGFLTVLLMIGVGYVIAEGVGAAVNRRRGRPYQLMAVGGTIIAVGPFAIFFGSLFTLLGAAIAAYVSWNRLAP